MSRQGRQPIEVPAGIEVKCDGNQVQVKGPKGTLHQTLYPGITLSQEGKTLHLVGSEETVELSKFHGLMRALVHNMVYGVQKGFEVRLEMVGVGYRAALQGKKLDLQIGLSHPTKLDIPEGIHVAVEANVNIIITGADKQRVGQFAATVRAKKPPEPYQGKGIRYKGEYVRKKAGKTAAAKK
jgi:large subunit ribosomal protein L6